MSSKPVLYMNPRSPPARAVMMVIDILGIDVEYKVLNALLREQDTPELRKGPIYAGRCGELTKSMIRSIEDAYSIIEMYLSDNLYVASDVMTIADLSIFSSVSSLNGLIPVDGLRYPKLKVWLTRMCAKDFSRRINQPGSDELVQELTTLMKDMKQKLNAKL